MKNSYQIYEKSEALIYEKASLSRIFEEHVFKLVQEKIIKIPVYLSAGQEYISSSIATFYSDLVNNKNIQIFIQHRGHSTYLAFGGDMESLVYELLGDKRGCAGGMGGSASIHSKSANIYGHDGLMGSHGPISVGMCYANKIPTLCFIGDAAAEEDYFLAALGWASTKELPIIFIVEDNNLSILTEKKVRRNWNIEDVATGLNIRSANIDDNPKKIFESLSSTISSPLLLNINTNRYFWHSGAGVDNVDQFDRHKSFSNLINDKLKKEVDDINKNIVESCWSKCLKN